MIRFFLIFLIINEFISTPNGNHHSFNPRGLTLDKLQDLFNFVSTLKPSMLVNNLLNIKSGNSSDTSDFYINEEQKEWFLSHLEKREELAKVVKIIYKVIAFKKFVKFFILMLLLFFLPVLNSNGPVYNEHALKDENSYDVTNFISESFLINLNVS